jgi:hypothetical protein
MSTAVREWMTAKSSDQNFGFDMAESVTFNSMVLGLPSFDRRSAAALEECALSNTSAMERERALWELAYRENVDISKVIRKFFRDETHPRVRANALWLALKRLPEQIGSLLQEAQNDPDKNVRDWGKLYTSELSSTLFQSEYNRGTFVRGRAFDQTLPLQIAGFAVVALGGDDFRIVLSPEWFAHIQGRVMACTRDETFMTRLTIEKCYFGYHPDGSDHHEIYPFAGKSWRSGPEEVEHRYITRSEKRPFYLSGRVEEDPSSIRQAQFAAARAARTIGRYMPVLDRDEGDPATDLERVQPIAERRVVSHVRGQYFGWAFASTRHYLESGQILPGTVQLLSPTEPATADLINCYICGTFRGKLGDNNGDGFADVNDEICHGSEDGRLDYNGDRTFTADPFA